MELKNGVEIFYPPDRASLRDWLQANHVTQKSVWIVLYKKGSAKPTISLETVIEEALCFGWIDSKPNKRDEDSYYFFISKRNPKSNWSRVNKINVERLISEGRMTSAGLTMINLAKEIGTWNALDDVDNLIVPIDLQKALDEIPVALNHWKNFSRSIQRGILEWILNAKTESTRQNRIVETVLLAEQNKRANQYPKETL